MISVVFPVLDAENFLRSAIESMLMQTFTDLELLLFDDGSADSSLEIMREYERLDPRVRVISMNHRGLVETLNHGLKLARANLVARMDADDISLSHRLTAQYDRFLSDPQLWVLGTAVQEIDERGRVIRTPLVQTDQEAIVRNLPKWSPVWHPTVMMRRDRILSIGGYRSLFRYAEDYDLWLRVAGAAGKIDNLPEVGLQYRIHTSMISVMHRARQEQSARRAAAAYMARLRSRHVHLRSGPTR